jgi:hypothetical protein
MSKDRTELQLSRWREFFGGGSQKTDIFQYHNLGFVSKVLSFRIVKRQPKTFLELPPFSRVNVAGGLAGP